MSNSRGAGFLLVLGLLALMGSAQSSGLQHYFEDGGLVRGHQKPRAVGADAFGERWDPFTGAVSFRQVDVSIPGNSALPLEVARTLTTGVITAAHWDEPRRMFADWELEYPHIKAIVGEPTWKVGVKSTPSHNNARCSRFWDEASSFSYPVETAAQASMVALGGVSEAMLDPAGTRPTLAARTVTAVTKSGWQFYCIPLLAPASEGEGFVAVSPQGVEYRFDRLISRRVLPTTKPSPLGGPRPATRLSFSSAQQLASPLASSAPFEQEQQVEAPLSPHLSVQVERFEVRLVPSQVKDRFGNTLDYLWNAQDPWQLDSISASDGRVVNFQYTNKLISGVNVPIAGETSRAWTYEYEDTGSKTADRSEASLRLLKRVRQPDGSAWEFSGASLQYKPLVGTSYVLSAGEKTKNFVHPSGLVGSFTLARRVGPMRAGKISFHTLNANQVLAERLSLIRKKLSGPGLNAVTWSYGDYVVSNSQGSFEVTSPDQGNTRYTFGLEMPAVNQDPAEAVFNHGLLLRRDDGWNGTSALRSTVYEYAAATGATYSSRFGFSHDVNGDGPLTALNRPQLKITITQQGRSFVWEAQEFDVFARTTRERRIGTDVEQNRSTQFRDDASMWVLGLTESQTINGLNAVQHGFDSKLNISSRSSYGIAQFTQHFNTDGTLASRTDGRNHTTYFDNYKRGLPQAVRYPDGSSESAVVNDLGLVTSVKSAAGITTGYGYDSMGRLASITPPAGWAATTLRFEPVQTDEYGLPAGHWRQTISKGNARTLTYFDALWRPVMTRSFDAGDEANTRKVTVKSYDADGRVTFESYPQRNFETVAVSSPGKRSRYDALGRLEEQVADSELGPLSSSTEYLSGFQVRHTNPRGKQSTQTLWALDNPSESQLSAISVPAGDGLPGGMSVSIERDDFGKPTRITRGGHGVSVTRSYVYDEGQRLCKTVEPETGATIQDYDAAGNIAWRAPGQTHTGLDTCDRSLVPETARITHQHDKVNQLELTRYGDGSPSVTRSYTPDGKLETISTSSGDTWTYGYNSLRLLETESFSYAGQTFDFRWSYDSYGNLSKLSYPTGGPVVSYAPNALGEPSQVGAYASAVKFHPNGAVASYTLGNGIAHSLTQNLRGLPLVNRDAGVMQDQYSYDPNGNVTAITDQQEAGLFNRAMTYDELDRLWTANAPGVWGNASYSYDAVDNLKSATVGSRSSVFSYDEKNRLSRAVTTGGTASSTLATQSFDFDLGNRLRSSSLGGGYLYDGHGRRIRVHSSDGSTRLQLYSQAGQILWATSSGGPRPAGSMAYIYLGGKQIAEWASAGNLTQYVHTDVLGSPVAHTNASGGLMNRTRFEPYGFTAAGTKPGPNTSSIGFTGHVNDPETDLVYMQQRYYDPIAGRFLSVDPIVTDANTGKGFGLYTYVDNNPYSKIDPDGRNPIVIAVVACARTPACVRAGAALMAATGKAVSNALQNASKPEPKKDGEGASEEEKANSSGGDTEGKRVPSGLRDEILEGSRNPDGSWTCWRCGGELSDSDDVDIGHKNVPRSKGGNLHPDNLACEGKACNRSAGNRGSVKPGSDCISKGCAKPPEPKTKPPEPPSGG